MAVAQTNSINMVHGSLWDKILKFSALYMMTAVLQHLYSAADIIVVGRFSGQEALAGVGTCAAIINLFLNFILGLSAGATIVLAQAIGASDKGEISKATHTTISVAIIGGAVITAICLLFTEALLKMIDVPQECHRQEDLRLKGRSSPLCAVKRTKGLRAGLPINGVVDFSYDMVFGDQRIQRYRRLPFPSGFSASFGSHRPARSAKLAMPNAEP